MAHLATIDAAGEQKPDSSHFSAGQGEHDRFGQLPQTEWLREKLCIGAEVVGHQRGIREAGHKENGQVGPSAARLTRQVNAGHAAGQENIGQQQRDRVRPLQFGDRPRVDGQVEQRSAIASDDPNRTLSPSPVRNFCVHIG